MPPASANDSHTAEPATAAVVPRSEKMPAPTIAPTPMKAASRVDTYRVRGVSVEAIGSLGLHSQGVDCPEAITPPSMQSHPFGGMARPVRVGTRHDVGRRHRPGSARDRCL